MNPPRLLFFPLLFGAALAVTAGPPEVLLWPNGAPGSEDKTAAEIVEPPNPSHNYLRVTSIHKPSLTVFLPSKEKATGAAVIIAPGGGHAFLAFDHEGLNVGQWLSEHGIAGFVLKYRLAREKDSTYTVDGNAVPDMQRAIRLVRSRAQEWEVNPARVGVMGFSAGGELAALASMHFDNGVADAADPVDRLGCKPDFQALIYPGGTKRIVPAKDSPPAFLLCGANDRPDISEGLANIYILFKKAGVPVELHIYAGTGHGFGYRESNHSPSGAWPQRFEDWLRARVLPASGVK